MIVRFLVGTPQEDALIKVYSKLYSNFDRMPPGVSQPLIKARSIDDVPILALTLWGEHYDGYQLRAIAAEMQHNIEQISDVSETTIIGGLPRTMRVVLSTEKLSAYGLSPMAIVGHLQAANASVQAGSFAENNQEIRVDAGNLFTSREDLEAVVVGVVRGHPVYLRDVAEKIVDGAAEPANYVVYGTTNAGASAAAPVSGGDHHRGQAQGHQRHRYLERRAQARPPDAGRDHTQRRDRDDHAKLRRDGQGQVG